MTTPSGRTAAGDPALVEIIGRTAGSHRRVRGLAVSAVRAARRATVGLGTTAAAGSPIDGDSSFQIGSVTKVFTALLLCDAVAAGDVSLDQRLDTLIPSATNHPDGPPITLADLAMHTSGLPRLPPGLRRQAVRNRHDPYAGFTTDDVLDALTRRPRRPAGARSRYSNFGAGVLGEALARARGARFGELVSDRITDPLAMGRTGTDRPPDGRNVAEGHDRRGRAVADWHLPSLAGAGALRSTADDLLWFLGAHLDPASCPLSEAVELCIQPRRRLRGPLRIALGWHVWNGATVRPRGGTTVGRAASSASSRSSRSRESGWRC